MRLFEETVESRVIFRGKIVTLREDVARLENGALARREVVEHPDGVCILPMEADGTVYTVRQFRYPFGEVTEGGDPRGGRPAGAFRGGGL